MLGLLLACVPAVQAILLVTHDDSNVQLSARWREMLRLLLACVPAVDSEWAGGCQLLLMPGTTVDIATLHTHGRTFGLCESTGEDVGCAVLDIYGWGAEPHVPWPYGYIYGCVQPYGQWSVQQSTGNSQGEGDHPAPTSTGRRSLRSALEATGLWPSSETKRVTTSVSRAWLLALCAIHGRSRRCIDPWVDGQLILVEIVSLSAWPDTDPTPALALASFVRAPHTGLQQLDVLLIAFRKPNQSLRSLSSTAAHPMGHFVQARPFRPQPSRL